MNSRALFDFFVRWTRHTSCALPVPSASLTSCRTSAFEHVRGNTAWHSMPNDCIASCTSKARHLFVAGRTEPTLSHRHRSSSDASLSAQMSMRCAMVLPSRRNYQASNNVESKEVAMSRSQCREVDGPRTSGCRSQEARLNARPASSCRIASSRTFCITWHCVHAAQSAAACQGRNRRQ